VKENTRAASSSSEKRGGGAAAPAARVGECWAPRGGARGAGPEGEGDTFDMSDKGANRGRLAGRTRPKREDLCRGSNRKDERINFIGQTATKGGESGQSVPRGVRGIKKNRGSPAGFRGEKKGGYHRGNLHHDLVLRRNGAVDPGTPTARKRLKSGEKKSIKRVQEKEKNTSFPEQDWQKRPSKRHPAWKRDGKRERPTRTKSFGDTTIGEVACEVAPTTVSLRLGRKRTYPLGVELFASKESPAGKSVTDNLLLGFAGERGARCKERCPSNGGKVPPSQRQSSGGKKKKEGGLVHDPNQKLDPPAKRRGGGKKTTVISGSNRKGQTLRSTLRGKEKRERGKEPTHFRRWGGRKKYAKSFGLQRKKKTQGKNRVI